MNDEEIKESRRILKSKLRGMKKRCYDAKNKDFHSYGAKGITVCESWLNSEEDFITWALTHGYKKGLTIERLNNKRGYEPDNCKFIPMSQQPLNTSRNVYIKYHDEICHISEVARRENVSCEAIRKRIKHGWYEIVDNPNYKVEPIGNT